MATNRVARRAVMVRGLPWRVARGVYRVMTFAKVEAEMSQDGRDAARSMKVLGRRRPSRGGLVAAAPFLDLVIRLRSGRPFIPKGIHRFRSFEESAAWSMQMMTARSNPGRRG
jgi:hypothetical protein